MLQLVMGFLFLQKYKREVILSAMIFSKSHTELAPFVPILVFACVCCMNYSFSTAIFFFQKTMTNCMMTLHLGGKKTQPNIMLIGCDWKYGVSIMIACQHSFLSAFHHNTMQTWLARPRTVVVKIRNLFMQ